MFTIDGSQWPYPCDVKRTAELKASEISGLLLDKSYFNDVVGTYMQYDVTIAVPLNKKQSYYGIYGLLTKPVDGHIFVLPYNGETITVTGRVDSVTDTYVRLPGNANYWKGISFTVTANHPSRTMTLGQAISRGMTPLPDVVEPQDGDTYTYNAATDAWVKVTT